MAQIGTTFTANTNSNVTSTSGAGNVTLNYPCPVYSVTLSYVCGDAPGTGNMVLFISDLTFCLNS